MNKVLVVASIAPMIEAFNKENLMILQQLGNEVHVAANFYEKDKGLRENNQSFKEWLESRDIVVHDVPIQRIPLAKENWESYRLLKEMMDQETYTMVHAHTPIGGVLARVAGRKSRKKGTSLIYTAHGFHFFKGAPLKNWVLYYPVEKFLARWTDCLITINPEDYRLATEKGFGATNIEYVKGVGVDLSVFKQTNRVIRNAYRKYYRYEKDRFIIIYVGELAYRKNQAFAVDMMAHLIQRIPEALLLLVGEGEAREELEKKIQVLGLEKNVKLLGYRTDIPELMSLSDVAFSSSRQEGLPVNVMEAMASGLPVVVSDCRGNRDLVEHKHNGFVFQEDDLFDVLNRLERLALSPVLREKFGRTNRERIEPFGIEAVDKEMTQIYRKYTTNSSEKVKTTQATIQTER